jgi:hypothetical protein
MVISICIENGRELSPACLKAGFCGSGEEDRTSVKERISDCRPGALPRTIRPLVDRVPETMSWPDSVV